jgi:hypothetical protein
MCWLERASGPDFLLTPAASFLQAKHRLLRRSARVLAAAGQDDPVLAGLHQHVSCSSSSLPQLSTALAAAVHTHQQLGKAFKEGLADGGYRVIWRAFRLMCRLYRTRVRAAGIAWQAVWAVGAGFLSCGVGVRIA